MDFETWVAEAPEAIAREVIWRVQAFRIGTFLAECAVTDAGSLRMFGELVTSADQMVRAAGSIPANVAEGYSRRSRHDRIRYYEYALGSANECKAWYMAARARLGSSTAEHRLGYLGRVTQLLLVMIRNERRMAEQTPARRQPGEKS